VDAIDAARAARRIAHDRHNQIARPRNRTVAQPVAQPAEIAGYRDLLSKVYPPSMF
jgi:hypothetical protein